MVTKGQMALGVLVVGALGVGAVVYAKSKQKTLTLTTPLADGWVSAANPATNLNGSGLGIGFWSYANRSLLNFGLGSLGIPSNRITGAELALYGAARYPPLTVNALFTANYFDEKTVTWDTQPPPSTLGGVGSLMGYTSDIPTSPGWFKIALDPAFLKVRLGSTFLVILESSSESEPNNYCYAEDKEGGLGFGAQYAPQLLIHYLI